MTLFTDSTQLIRQPCLVCIEVRADWYDNILATWLEPARKEPGQKSAAVLNIARIVSCDRDHDVSIREEVDEGEQHSQKNAPYNSNGREPFVRILSGDIVAKGRHWHVVFGRKHGHLGIW